MKLLICYMYNSKFICTYNYYDPSLCGIGLQTGLKIDMDDCEDLEDMADILYRAELLQIFGISEYDDNVIGTIMHDLFLQLESNEELQICMKNAAAVFLSEDIETGFIALFSYTNFFVTHRCICEFLENGTISSESMLLLHTHTK